MIKAIAFDIDGTLYKSISFSMRCIPFAVKNLRFMINFGIVRKQLRTKKMKTKSGEEFFLLQAELLAKRLGWKVDYTKEFIDKEIYYGWRSIFKKISPYGKAFETIAHFKSLGYKIGIMSDFPPEQKNNIWGIADLSDAVLGAENCGALKPDSKPFLQLAEKLKLQPKAIMYVGNSYKYDIVGAKNVGMQTAYICNPVTKFFNRKKADIVFSSYDEFCKKFIEYVAKKDI